MHSTVSRSTTGPSSKPRPLIFVIALGTVASAAGVAAVAWFSASLASTREGGESQRLHDELGQLSAALDDQEQRLAELARRPHTAVQRIEVRPPGAPPASQAAGGAEVEEVREALDPEPGLEADDLDETARVERDVERNQRAADDLDARRYAGIADPSTFRAVETLLERSGLPVLTGASEGGCSETICSFTLRNEASPLDSVDQAAAVLHPRGFAHLSIMKLPDGSVRVYATRKDEPLRRQSL